MSQSEQSPSDKSGGALPFLDRHEWTTAEALQWALQRVRTSLDCGEYYAKAEIALRAALSAPSAASSAIPKWCTPEAITELCYRLEALDPSRERAVRDLRDLALRTLAAPSSEGTNDPMTWEYWRDRARKAESASPSHERSSVPAYLTDVLLNFSQGSCPACGWNLELAPEKGCTPFNCSFRPSEGSPEHGRWLPRAKAMQEVLEWAQGKSAPASATRRSE